MLGTSPLRLSAWLLRPTHQAAIARSAIPTLRLDSHRHRAERCLLLRRLPGEGARVVFDGHIDTGRRRVAVLSGPLCRASER